MKKAIPSVAEKQMNGWKLYFEDVILQTSLFMASAKDQT